MKIEMGGKYTTRDGRPVRILCVDGPDPQPIIGVIQGARGPSCWGFDGQFSAHLDGAAKQCDLIPAKPEPVVEWGYVAGDHFTACASERIARQEAGTIGFALMRNLAKRTTEIIEP